MHFTHARPLTRILSGLDKCCQELWSYNENSVQLRLLWISGVKSESQGQGSVIDRETEKVWYRKKLIMRSQAK